MADGGNYDNRYYVTDEMWATEPYNKFVYFETGDTFFGWFTYAHCSAQYIAPNLILTAGHCISGPKYRATNYKHETFDLQPVYNRHNEKEFGTEDWAVLLVKNRKYYSDTFFEPEKIRQQTDMLHAGWGWVRILTDDEINTIMNLLESVAGEESKHMSVEEISKTLKAEMEKNNIEQFRDKENRLKASRCHSIYCSELKEKMKHAYDELNAVRDKKNECVNECFRKLGSDMPPIEKWRICENDCKELYEQENNCFAKWSDAADEYYDCAGFYGDQYPYIIRHTCTTWGGDSGGGFVSEISDKIYGVCSFHSGEDLKGINTRLYMASSWQFDEKVRKLREIYSTSNTPAKNIRIAKKNRKKVQELLNSGLSFDDLYIYDIKEPEESDTTDTDDKTADDTDDETAAYQIMYIEKQMNILHQELSETDAQIHEQIKNINTLNSSEKLQLLDNLAAHEVKSEQLAELQKAYEEALAREQSLSNRILGAAAIGATGIGGMMAAGALAEQRADAAAERATTAYIETMRCDYADGKSVRGGETNIELPGGNDMIALYTEYATLANDLKMRKELLGLSPGIESEVVIDKADTGLYDNAGIGITGGVYASIARAIMNPDGEDAKKWAEQKAQTEQNLKIGTGVAGAGAIGGAVGNIAINGPDGNGWPRDKNDK